MGRAYCLGWLNRAAPGLQWCTILISLIMLLKVWGWRPWRFRRGLLYQAPWKINQSFIKVRSPRELRNQIEQCSRLVSRYCSIKLSYCWGRWLKYSLPHKTWVLCAGNWKIRLMCHCKTFLLKDSFFFLSSLPSECGTCFVWRKNNSMRVHSVYGVSCGGLYAFLNMQTFYSLYQLNSHFFKTLCSYKFAWGGRERLPDIWREYTGRSRSYCYITYYCNAISKQEYLSHRSGSLSLRRGTPVHTLWLDEAFLQARHFYLAGPCWISPVKRWNTWSVSAVMVNEGNDSEFENVLMTPLETALPLNLEEAVSIRSPTLSPTPSQGFPMMLAGTSPRRWCEIILSRAMDTMCVWDLHDRLCFSNNAGFLFFFQIPIRPRHNVGIHKYLDVNIL